MTPMILGTLALGLAGPAPSLLGRARWTSRVPRAALVLWQALAMAAILAALGAGLSASVAFVSSTDPQRWQVVGHVGVFFLTATVAGRLVWATLRVGVITRLRRYRHRELVDLVASADSRLPGLRVLGDDQPIAYCLPGTLTRRVVVSAGTLSHLSPAELEAVLDHEQAHLRARHDLVLEAFTALHAAFPRGVSSAPALGSVRVLVEMLADDVAERRSGQLPLARALVTLAAAPVPSAGFPAGDRATVERIRRLGASRAGNQVLAAATYALAATLLVVPSITVAFPWLGAVRHVMAI